MILRISGLCLLLALLITLACKKGKNAEDEVGVKTVTLDKSSAAPGEIVNIKSSFSLDKDSWEITVGTKKVQLSRLSDSTAAFFVPYLDAGDVTIDFSGMGVVERSSLTIGSYTPVNDPAPVKMVFETILSQEIDESSSPDAAACLNSLKENFSAGYDKLNEQEKKELAFHIQKLLALEINSETVAAKRTFLVQAVATKKTSVTKISGIEDFEVPGKINSDIEYRQTIIQCLSLYTISGSTLYLGANMAASISPWTQAAGFATLAFSLYTFSKANRCRLLILGYAGENKSVEDASLVSYSVLSSVKAKSAILGATSQSFANSTFLKNYTHTVNVTGKFETASLDSKLGIVQNFIAGLNSFAATYTKALSLINAVSTWISGKPAFPPFNPGIPAKGTEQTKILPGNYLTIGNVSDPAITLLKIGNGTDLQLKASSSIPDPRSFTFDLIYNSPLGSSSQKSISAIYDGTTYPEKVSISSGNNQNGEEDKKLSNPLVVLVTDIQSNPVANATVEWRIKIGAGSLSAATSKTNAQGLASIEWTLDASGSQEVEAIVRRKDGSLTTGSPLTFRASSCQDAEAPVIGSISFRCTEGDGLIISIPFTSRGSDIDAGQYNPALYFKNPGAASFSLASNSYDWRLASGTPREGVIEMWLTGAGRMCMEGKGARETLEYMYKDYEWKIDLTNKCGLKSSAVSF